MDSRQIPLLKSFQCLGKPLATCQWYKGQPESVLSIDLGRGIQRRPSRHNVVFQNAYENLGFRQEFMTYSPQHLAPKGNIFMSGRFLFKLLFSVFQHIFVLLIIAFIIPNIFTFSGYINADSLQCMFIMPYIFVYLSSFNFTLFFQFY